MPILHPFDVHYSCAAMLLSNIMRPCLHRTIEQDINACLNPILTPCYTVRVITTVKATCATCFIIKTPTLISYHQINSAVKAAYPNVTILYWDDMVDPFHLHAPDSDQDNLQAQHYGREDKTLDTAMQLVTDKSTVWLNWFYDWP